MMKNFLFQFIGLIIVMLVVVFYSLNNLRGGNAASLGLFQRNQPQESIQAQAIRATRTKYNEAKKANTDFSQSPCLAIDLGNGYALDVVHDPRIEADTLNQCESYTNGTVLNLVEILPDGTIVNIID